MPIVLDYSPNCILLCFFSRWIEMDGEKDPYSILSVAVKCDCIDLATLLLVHGFNPDQCQIYDVLNVLTAIEREHYMSESFSEEGESFIECLFSAGYRPKEPDKWKLEEFISCHKDITSVKIQKLLEAFIHDKVKTLKQTCCLCIRSHLITVCQGRSILNSISILPIPQSIQDSVSFENYLKPANSYHFSCVSFRLEECRSHFFRSCCSWHEHLLLGQGKRTLDRVYQRSD